MLKCLALVVLAAAPASAATIADNSVSSTFLFTPTVDLNTTPSTYSVVNGGTLQSAATGIFASASTGTGTFNGTISFSNTRGVTLNETLNNLFVFNNGRGGTFNFSGNSVVTRNFSNIPGITTSVALYILGSTLDTSSGADATPSSLTITFNSTGTGAFNSSGSLSAIPQPSSNVPEPASWAMMITGFGLVGAATRRRKVPVSFA